MACYHPLKGFRSRTVTKAGKRPIVFNHKEGYADMPVEVACGQCIGCRLERSRQWAVRCVHEAMQHDFNCFVTLTYADEHLPKDGSVNLEHFQKFIKKLRKVAGAGIRYFHCGEYGDKLRRPHYHACIFGYDFPDKRFYKLQNGYRLYTSDLCERFWSYKGYCVLGDVTFQSAAYVARYIMKKVNGKNQDEHYGGLKPEYTTMSRRPGIGKAYFDKYHEEIYKDDFIVIDGKKVRVPRYYDGQLELIDPDRIASLKISRKLKGDEYEKDNTPRRREVKEKVQTQRNKKLQRIIHD